MTAHVTRTADSLAGPDIGVKQGLACQSLGFVLARDKGIGVPWSSVRAQRQHYATYPSFGSVWNFTKLRGGLLPGVFIHAHTKSIIPYKIGIRSTVPKPPQRQTHRAKTNTPPRTL